MARRRWNWLVLPPLLAFGATFIPALLTFGVLSLHPSAGTGAVLPEWTLGNYARVLTDSLYLTALGRTVLLGVLTVLGTLVLGLPLAYLIVRDPTRVSRDGAASSGRSSLYSGVTLASAKSRRAPPGSPARSTVI